jgi:hypothetical protein
MMDLLKEVHGVEAVFLTAGTVLAFFGWEIFRLVRVTVGAAAGGLAGWGVSELLEIPAGLVARGVSPERWTLLLVLCGALCGFLLLRMIRSLGSFLPGMILGYFTARAFLSWMGSEESLWSFAPPVVPLAAVAGGAAVLVSEKTAVIVMTAAIGSGLAGEALPWRYSVPLFFLLAAPLQWWVQAGRPWPSRRRRGSDEEEF